MPLTAERTNSDSPSIDFCIEPLIGSKYESALRGLLFPLLVFLSGFYRLRYPGRLRTRLRRQQLLHQLIQSFVYVAVFAVENQLARLQCEVSAVVNLLHECLVE